MKNDTRITPVKQDKRINRRQLLRQVAFVTMGATGAQLLAACATATTAPSSAAPVPTSVASAPTAAATTAPTDVPTDTPSNTTTATGDSATSKVVAAAQAFLATLNDSQKSQVQFDFADAAQLVKWSNFPTGLFQRAGLRMGDLSQAQKDAALAIVAATFSQKGYQQVVAAINADEVLKNADGGGRLIFGQDEYYISLLGEPSEISAWMWQFGGHHMAWNATLVGSNITLAPSLNGGQPMEYTLNGQTVRIMDAEFDASFTLINALDATQQSKAIIGTQVINLVLGPGEDGKTTQAEGIQASELTADQRTLLLNLINERVGVLNDANAALKMAEIKANLNDTYFAWSGPTTEGSAAYYRIQGPTVIIEFSPQSMGGSAINHIHAMYREPANDYGAKWTK